SLYAPSTIYTRHHTRPRRLLCFFFNPPATTEIYTLSLHDALPILAQASTRCSQLSTTSSVCCSLSARSSDRSSGWPACSATERRSEEHTSELQSLTNLVCRLLLEKKKKITIQQLSTANSPYSSAVS